MKKTRKGFTLVELLIVIAIVGTLAAMMTLSSTNATASAEATKVVSALRSARTATIMFYWDHPDLHSEETASNVESKFTDEIGDYLEAAADGGDATSHYTLKLVGTGAASKVTWYVGYAPSSKVTDVVKKRLAGQANSYGLYSWVNNEMVSYTANATDTKIYMKVREAATASSTQSDDDDNDDTP